MAIVRFLTFALFTWLAVTVVAFVYFEWWQAILASLGTLYLMLLGARWLLLSFARDLKGFAKQLVGLKGRVLRGASVDVHSVKPVEPPRHLAEPDEDEPPADPADVAQLLAEMEGKNWYEIELTVFPDPKAGSPIPHWDVYDLIFVPAEAREAAPADDSGADDEVSFSDVEVVVNGEPRDPENGKLRGPQRLRILAGFPRGMHAVQFRYYTEQFGHVALPG